MSNNRSNVTTKTVYFHLLFWDNVSSSTLKILWRIPGLKNLYEILQVETVYKRGERISCISKEWDGWGLKPLEWEQEKK